MVRYTQVTKSTLITGGRRLRGVFFAVLTCLAVSGQTPARAEQLTEWQTVQTLILQGRLADALPRLERMVTQAPNDTRARIELAAVLLRVGQGTRARYHFSLARGGDLPPRARATVDGLLAGLPLRGGWDGALSFSLSPESNPARGTTGFILVAGRPVEVGTAGAGASGQSAGVTGELLRLRPTGSRSAIFGGGSVNARFRSGQLADEATIAAFAGLRLIRGATRTDLRLRWSERFIDSAALAQGPGVEVTHLRPIGKRGTLAANLSADDLTYEGLPGLDGVQRGAALSYSQALSPSTNVSGTLSWFRRGAVAPSSRYSTVRQSIGISHLFPGGLSVGVTAGYSRSWRDTASGFFTIVREDNRRDLTLRLSHAHLSVRGFAPTLEIGREEQDSTIPLERYDNNRLSLGLTRRF